MFSLNKFSDLAMKSERVIVRGIQMRNACFLPFGTVVFYLLWRYFEVSRVDFLLALENSQYVFLRLL